MDKLISFALPLMISGILQLAFNAVDIDVYKRQRIEGVSSASATGTSQ